MSNCCSWIEREVEGKRKVYFLTGKQVFHTKKGKELQEELHGDFIGHSAIRFYYDLPDTSQRGRLYEKECDDFSTPDKFPTIIVRAIKRGDMRGMATPNGLLTAQAYKVWQEATAQPYKVRQEAEAQADKVWQEATAQPYKVWQEAKDTSFWDLFAIPENRNPIWR